MSQEQMISPAKEPSVAKVPMPAKVAGVALMSIEAIPPSVGHLMRDKMGQGSVVLPARENGTYKGKIIYTDDHFVGQQVGREGNKAILHRKDDLALQGNELKWRVDNNRLNNAGVQVFYNGDKAKAYPFNLEKQQAAIGEQAKTSSPSKPRALTPEQFQQQASDYASANIKNVKQRDAFLKHLGAATDQTKTTPEVEKPAKAPPVKAQAKSVGRDIER